jgi:membrane AbrB-like protein
MRVFFVPVIGVMIGGAFTRELIGAIPQWWPTVLALLIYVPVAHAMSYAIYRRIGRYDCETAFFAAAPGGLIEAIALGEEAGADPATLTLLQFSRLLLCIVIVPLAFTLFEGVAVGSAAGVSVGAADRPPLSLNDAVILIACGVFGYLAFKRLRFPAAIITGPILCSGVVHLLGVTNAQPPTVLIAITQLVIGITLGVRFATMDRSQALRGLFMALISVASVLVLALAFGLTLYGLVGETAEAVVLSYAPGGVTEMTLIALSLQISVVFVTLHHVARIVITISYVRFAYRLLLRFSGGAGPAD